MNIFGESYGGAHRQGLKPFAFRRRFGTVETVPYKDPGLFFCGHPKGVASLWASVLRLSVCCRLEAGLVKVNLLAQLLVDEDGLLSVGGALRKCDSPL
jgi:hypothetical protein